MLERELRKAVLLIITAIAVTGCSTADVQKKGAPTITVHTYPEGPCHVCHRGSGELVGSETLLAPGKELCFQCHSFRTDGKFVHKAIDIWGCTICHDPHGTSGYPSLLRDPLPELCFGCHESEAIISQGVHRDLTQTCIACHDPHMGNNKFLLK
ncbi:MAG TPA: cytochrome c3 family protein [Thermodesulfovibrionales bacterium]|nr:cytochrome c3 family protein [Thermodesulfovibrionales bacterium]